jgi:CRP-like cAMP-binding protein
MSEFRRLRAYLEGKAAFTEADFAHLETLYLPKTLSAGEFFQRAGEPATHGAFVATGCLRSYIVDAEGREHIVQFAPEDWWIGEQAGFTTPGAPAQYFIDAVEDSNLLVFDRAAHEWLIANVPGAAAAYRAGLERRTAATDQRIVNALSTSAEERYEAFVRKYPTIVQRVPQFMLASYLGITPETLSRVRRHRSRK